MTQRKPKIDHADAHKLPLRDDGYFFVFSDRIEDWHTSKLRKQNASRPTKKQKLGL